VVDGIFTTMIRVNLSYGIKKATRVSTYSSGMCFGEIVFLTGQPRTADVIALLRALSSELGSNWPAPATSSPSWSTTDGSSTEPRAAAGGGVSLL
jgi:hypothetical protein